MTDAQTVTTAEEEDRKLVFRVPADLHQRIKEAAETEDRSMASWVRRVCEAALNGTPQT